MKITLISPYPDIASIGMRTISSTLKREGFETRLIFLPNVVADKSKKQQFSYLYPDNVLEETVELAADSRIVGITVMTNYFEGTVQITEAIKKNLKTQVIWGGIHPTIRPEECLGHSDMVCLGEGEYALSELAGRMKEGEDYCNIENLWFKRDGRIIKNPLRPLVQDLDSLPFPDYDLETHYLLEEGKVRPMDESLLQNALAGGSISRYMNLTAYQTMATRGCPHRCTYCCNDTLRNLYPGQKYVRRRNVGNIIEELLQVKGKFPFVEAFWISDDSFFAANEEEIKKFSRAYKEKIGLPFFCLGSPTTITEKKVDHLVDAGMRCIQMGVQTGSRRVCHEVYHRRISNDQVIDAARAINKHKKRLMPPLYDFILDNDYEEEADILETLGLMLKLPRPHHLQLFSLVLYPGTQLYSRAKGDGVIYDDTKQIYRKRYHLRRSTYLNFLFSLAQNNFPKILLRLLISKSMVKIFNRKSFDRIYEFAFGLARKLKRVMG